MVYEIPREIFKQKLLDRTNMCILQIVGANVTQDVPYKEVKTIQFPVNVEEFSKNYTNKNLSYLIYGFDQNSADAKKAADVIGAAGYPFVFFYQGSLSQDRVLDKGIN